MVIKSRTEQVPAQVYYLVNSPANAEAVGWDRLWPEYCLGDPSLPYVRHDTCRGIFEYVATVPYGVVAEDYTQKGKNG